MEDKLACKRCDIDLGKSDEGLEGAVKLLSDLPASYTKVDPETRRRFNQAIFKKLLVGVEGVKGSELTDEFRGLVDEKLPGRLEKIAVGPKSSHFEGGSNLELLVPEEGLEPPTRGL